MKVFGLSLIAAAVLMSPGAISNEWHRHQLNARAEEAGRLIAHEYRRTASEKVHVVYGYAEHGLICAVFTNEGADPASVRYAEAAWDPTKRELEYSMSTERWNEVCPDDGTRLNVTPAVEDGVAKGAQ